MIALPDCTRRFCDGVDTSARVAHARNVDPVVLGKGLEDRVYDLRTGSELPESKSLVVQGRNQAFGLTHLQYG